MSLKKKIAAAFIACAMTLAVVPSAFACTALYVGSDLTEDGTTMFGRIEDLGTNDYNKLFYVSTAGNHKAGEVYNGCYGFTYTFTHDSYRYTARRDDNTSGVCPDCDSTHEHTPYEEAGTNEKGVMVSATESLYGTDAVLSVDPYVDNGIEEAEITTVLLSEASTAREGVALLTSIYDNAGAAGGSGVFIADQNETWFVENLTGHTYLALKLSSSVVFMQPNVAAMGKIDLDDTDHVVASANLISVAQKAGTFVGDAAANVIDLDASYNGDIASDRMAAGLNYLYGTDTFTKDNYSETDFAISNVGENGAIVPVYSNIQLTKKFSVEDSIHFFQTEPIGKTGNVETHLFQVSATGDLNTAITEWTAFDDDVYNTFVPYYPLLTTDTADVYKYSPAKVVRSDEQPTEGVWYKDQKGRYYTYPEDWTKSFYGARDALSNLLTYGDVSEKDKAAAKADYAALQKDIMKEFAEMKAAVAAADTKEAKQAAATTASNKMSEKVYEKTVKMYNKLQKKQEARAWFGSLLNKNF
ncbi:C69 family dipeptidase [Faecalibacterium prausnitzii]|uniref:C69 family dipeptidase n=1 Tax=Faecalibacterium prausnitzii TaxID=853 RepID=UPI001170E990|nr:C69 family dipeptidase [Faecalibacterium prausnitzii]VUW97480.1 Dipeptidase [Faecalibacterium prausnitzii]